MAPKPQGFNLAGYLLPGALMAAAGAGLVMYIARRKKTVASEATQTQTVESSTPVSQEDRDRLRQALAEIED
jgi:uncharacterized membrane protein